MLSRRAPLAGSPGKARYTEKDEHAHSEDDDERSSRPPKQEADHRGGYLYCANATRDVTSAPSCTPVTRVLTPAYLIGW